MATFQTKQKKTMVTTARIATFLKCQFDVVMLSYIQSGGYL